MDSFTNNSSSDTYTCDDCIDELNKQSMFLKSEKMARLKLYKEYHYDRILTDCEVHDNWVPKYFKDDFQEYLVKRNKGSRYKYAMFTINFKEGIEPKEAEKKFKKAMCKKWIKHYYGTFEWRDENSGMHIHVRCDLDPEKNSYECKREMYNTFKNMVGNKLHVNVRYSNNDDSFIEYINGYKKNKKKDNYENDKKLIIKYKLKNIYMDKRQGGDYVFGEEKD